MPYNVFKGSTHKNILRGVDVASRQKFARDLMTKKSHQIAFVLDVIYKSDGMGKYPKTFQCDHEPESKRDVVKLLKKHNIETGKTRIKSKLTHTAFVEVCNKELAK